jgi:hypothetical protein
MLPLGLRCARPLNPEVQGVELGLGIVKLGAVCVPLSIHADSGLLWHPKIRS